MRIKIFICLALILFQGNVVAQGVKALHVDELDLINQQKTHQIEVFSKLQRLSEYKNISEKIQLLRKRKRITPAPSYTVGDTKIFNVRDILALDRWNQISAVCLYKSALVAIWMSESDLEFYSDSIDAQLLTDSLSFYWSQRRVKTLHF